MRSLLLSIALLAAPASAEPAADYAENLAQLRAEVDALSGEVALRKDELRGRLRGLSAQGVEIQATIRQQQLRMEQLALAAERERAAVTASEDAGAALAEAVLAGVEQLEATVRGGLPFRVEDRLDELDRIRAQLEAGDVKPERAASLLWGFVEDELRLARENTLDRQVIPLDGQNTLVSVARLGMVALYFKTEDGRAGLAAPTADGWRWTLAADTDEQRQIGELFDALSRQIRVGYFELPGALPAPEVQ